LYRKGRKVKSTHDIELSMENSVSVGEDLIVNRGREIEGWLQHLYTKTVGPPRSIPQNQHFNEGPI
jgi:hypothetical protein